MCENKDKTVIFLPTHKKQKLAGQKVHCGSKATPMKGDIVGIRTYAVDSTIERSVESTIESSVESVVESNIVHDTIGVRNKEYRILRETGERRRGEVERKES